MTREERFRFYEHLYFHEIERREQINGRLALPFAVLVAIVGIHSFMLNAPAKPTAGLYLYSFWTLLIGSAAALAYGAFFFRKAWFGHTDKLLPTAGHIEEYHRVLEQTYQGYQNQAVLVSTAFKDFLFNYFTMYSSENSINNDQRSYDIYRATVALTVSVLLAFAAAVPFFLATPITGSSQNDQTGPTTPSAPTAPAP